MAAPSHPIPPPKAPLEPSRNMVAVYDRYVNKLAPTRLHINADIKLAGDTYTVRDEAGEVILMSKPEDWNTLDKSDIYDQSSNKLYTLRDKVFTLHGSMVGDDTMGNRVFVASHNRGGDIQVQLFTTLATKQHKITKLNLNGDWFSRQGVLVDTSNGCTLARAGGFTTHASDVEITTTSHPASASEVHTRRAFRETINFDYGVEVAPNVDASLVAALCVVFDQMLSQSDY